MESKVCGNGSSKCGIKDASGAGHREDRDLDGGWAWVVFAGTLLNTMIYFGQMTSSQIYYVIFLEEFQASQSYTAWILAAQSAAWCATGPLTSYLQTKIGHRKLIMIGGLLYSMCFCLCHVANSIPFLILTYTISGMSCSFVHQGDIAALTKYFPKKAYRMLSLMFGGAGIGGMIMGLEVEWAVETFGWRGAMLIQAGIAMHICVGGALVFSRPADRSSSSKTTETKDTVESKWKTVVNYIRDIRLWLIVISFLMMNLTLSTMLALLKNIVIHYGLVEYFKYVVVAYGVGGTIGRGAVGFFSQRLCPPLTAMVMAGLGAAANFLFLFSTIPWLMCSVVFSFGLFLGANSVVLLLQIGWVYGTQSMAPISGCVFIFCVITTFCGAPVAGYTVDVTGSYDIAITMCSICSVVNSVASILLYVFHRRHLSKQTSDVISTPQESPL